MSIESVGAYSPNTVYGQLTMPFKDKPVHINAHTPLDPENGNTILTKKSFYNNQSEGLVSIEDIRDIQTLQLDDSLKVDIGIKMLEDFPPKPNVEVFQSSTYSGGSGVVFDALKNGYTGSEAINFGNAHNAYRNAMTFGNNPVKSLLSLNYTVA